MPAAASAEGEARIQQFQAVDGLRVSLWAAEPMLANPVSFSVDEKGRVFTSETYRYRTSVLDIRSYMFMLEDDLASRSIEDRLATIRKWFGPEGEAQLARETEVIRVLEDADGDGRADRSDVFADGFHSPLAGIGSGVLARRGQVWFTEIPSLWRFSAGAPIPPGRVGREGEDPALASRPVAQAEGYRADELLRGFGVRFSYTGHDLHGLVFGPDGRLYFSVGDRGARVVTREGNPIDLADEGAVFRCEPDGTDLEVVHRGLRNPQELAFNELGDLFTGDNDSDQGDRERWVQVVEGADSGWRVGHQHAPLGNAGMWNLERLWRPYFPGQAAYLLPPVANIGDGPSGLVADPGTGLPPELQGRFLITYFKGTSSQSGIASLAVRPRGAGYDLVAHDRLLWNSLVPDVDIGPDGSVWFADWHEGWPKSNKGRLYRARFPQAESPTAAETARLLAEGMRDRGTEALLGLLAHGDFRVRLDAQFELSTRIADGAAASGELTVRGRRLMNEVATVAGPGSSDRARRHATWVLAQLAVRHPEAAGKLLDLVDPALGEVATQAALGLARVGGRREPLPVRQSANLLKAGPVRPSAGWMPAANARLLNLFRSGDARQRVAAAQALGRLRVAEAVRPLRDRLVVVDPADVVERHALTLALARVASPSSLAALTRDGSAPVRMAAVVALRLHQSPRVAAFLADPDPLVALEAARAINDAPIPEALPALAALGDESRVDVLLTRLAAVRLAPAGPASGSITDVRADQPLPWRDAPVDLASPLLLRLVNSGFRVGDAPSARRLVALAVRSDLPERVRVEALRVLADWGVPPARDRITGTWRPLPGRPADPAREALAPVLATLLEEAPEPVRLGAVAAVAALRPDGAPAALAAVFRSDAAPAAVRADALRAFAEVAEDRAAVRTAVDAAAADPAEPVRLAASRLAAALDPSDAVGRLTAVLDGGSTTEKQAALATLGGIGSPAADAVLVDWLDRLVRREVPAELALDVVQAAGRREAAEVKSRLAAYQASKPAGDPLSPYREALAGGDAARGRRLFYENASVSCARCHRIGDDGGGNAGPALDGLAARATREHLLESIVFPNRQVAAGFETVLVTLRNDDTHAGIVRAETDTELVLLSADAGETRLAKADIAERDTGLSGMPEGLGDILSREELRDLVEFLGTLK